MSKPKTVKDIAYESMQKQIADLHAKIASLEKENQDLKSKPQEVKSSLIVNGQEIGSEDMVADLELRRLEEAARVRPLSLEEARIYDIMVRSKKTIKETRKKDENEIKDVTPKSISLADLIQIAKKDPPKAIEE